MVGKKDEQNLNAEFQEMAKDIGHVKTVSEQNDADIQNMVKSRAVANGPRFGTLEHDPLQHGFSTRADGQLSQLDYNPSDNHYKTPWLRSVDYMREITPAVIVNSAEKINFGFRLSGDVMTFMSGIRKGSGTWERATGAVISGSALFAGLFFDEKPLTEQQKEAMKSMNSAEFLQSRIQLAMDPQNHIMATVGFTTLVNGALNARSGLRNGMKAEVAKGLLTAAAGAALNLIPDPEKAWQFSQAIFMVRAPTSGVNAWQYYKYGNPAKNVPAGDKWQLGKFAMNQSSNVFGVFYGGVKKTEDGRIVRVADDEFLEQTPDLTTPRQITVEEEIRRGREMFGDDYVPYHLTKPYVGVSGKGIGENPNQNRPTQMHPLLHQAVAQNVNALNSLPMNAVQTNDVKQERLEQASEREVSAS